METQLTSKRVQQLNKQPILESTVSLSEDGRWVVHRTVITDIKSRAYLDKVLEN